jgi:glycosyltransferase involved in cell wall biosynthesis
LPKFVEVAHSTKYRLRYQVLGRLLNRYFDHVIAVSEDVKKSASAAGFPTISVLLAGADRNRFRHWVESNPLAARNLRDSINVPEKDTLIVAVGSLIKLKGHAQLIEALSTMPHQDISLAIVGDGPERASLQALAERLDCSARVHLLGRQEDGWRWTAVADLLVHPSHHEGLPIALVEAVVLGTPFLATDVGGVRQLAGSAPAGHVIPLSDVSSLAKEIELAIGRLPATMLNFETRASEESAWDINGHVRGFYSRLSDLSGDEW